MSVFAAVEATVFVIDVLPDGGMRYAGSNAAHARVSGIATADLVGRAPHDILPAADAAAELARYRSCVDGGVPVTYEVELPVPVPGTWYRTSLVPVKDIGGRVVRIVGSGFDITDRRRAERDVRERDVRERDVLLERAQRVGRLGTWAYDIAAGAGTVSSHRGADRTAARGRGRRRASFCAMGAGSPRATCSPGRPRST